VATVVTATNSGSVPSACTWRLTVAAAEATSHKKTSKRAVVVDFLLSKKIVMEAAELAEALWARARPWLRRLFRLTVGVTVACVSLSVLLALALGVYALAYYWLVPTPLHVFPVYLDFEQPQPTAVVPLPPGLLQAGQPYHLDVCLTAPATPRNRDRGMLMAKIALLAAVGAPGSSTAAAAAVLHQGGRPLHLPYTPAAARWVRNAVLLPLLAAGVVADTLSVCTRVLEDYVDGPPAARAARVTLSDPVLEVYTVELRVAAHMGGLAYAMHHWFVTSSVVGVAAAFSVLLSGLVTLLAALAGLHYLYGPPRWGWFAACVFGFSQPTPACCSINLSLPSPPAWSLTPAQSRPRRTKTWPTPWPTTPRCSLMHSLASTIFLLRCVVVGFYIVCVS
jgi:hypothetical protein